MQQSFAYSIPYFFIKSNFEVNESFIKGNVPNLLAFIPIGSNKVNIPLKQVAAVSIHTKFLIKKFLFNVVLSVIGLGLMSETAVGFLLLLIGIIGVLDSFKTLICISNTGGKEINYFISPFEKANASQFIDEINLLISKI